MKSCQSNLTSFLKFADALIRKEKKTIMQQSMKKEKLRKVGLCVITGCFTKFFNMVVNFFCFASSFAAQFLIFDIKMAQKISKGKVRNGKYNAIKF